MIDSYKASKKQSHAEGENSKASPLMDRNHELVSYASKLSPTITPILGVKKIAGVIDQLLTDNQVPDSYETKIEQGQHGGSFSVSSNFHEYDEKSGKWKSFQMMSKEENKLLPNIYKNLHQHLISHFTTPYDGHGALVNSVSDLVLIDQSLDPKVFNQEMGWINRVLSRRLEDITKDLDSIESNSTKREDDDQISNSTGEINDGEVTSVEKDIKKLKKMFGYLVSMKVFAKTIRALFERNLAIEGELKEYSKRFDELFQKLEVPTSEIESVGQKSIQKDTKTLREQFFTGFDIETQKGMWEHMTQQKMFPKLKELLDELESD
ncbi:MAG: hypothetical protein ACRCXZ_02110 [Patescibacteria group bacterium]